MAIIQPMINSLVLLYSLAFLNFGIAILIFTGIIRALMIPLTIRQSRQLKKMTDLQPKLKAVQARYPKDKQKLSQETMKVYRENGVNPIGCLGPLVIQFPIWIGLFQAIIQTLPSTPERLVGLSQHMYTWLPFVHEVIPLDSTFLWLDLSVPDPTPVMPVLVGASMWLTQKMTTMPSADPRQAQTNRMMLWMMPLMFGFFTLQFPSGLALYWVISNVVGIIIQGFITGWEPLLNVVDFKRKRATEPVAVVAGTEENLPKESEQDEVDRNDREDSGGRDRDRPKRVRRRSRRGRNRRR